MRGDSTFERYLSDIKKYRLLNEQETIELSKRAKKGDEEAKQALVNANLRLVISIVNDFINNKRIPETYKMDLIQEGNIGLSEATIKWDYKKSKFGYYAQYHIKSKITTYITNNISIVKLPQSVREKISKLQKIEEKFFDEYFRTPSPEELAAFDKTFTLKQIKDIKEQEILKYFASLDEEDENGRNLYDVLPDENQNVNYSDSEDEQRRQFDELVKRLPKKDRVILIMCRNELAGGNGDISAILKKRGYKYNELMRSINKARAELLKSFSDLNNN